MKIKGQMAWNTLFTWISNFAVFIVALGLFSVVYANTAGGSNLGCKLSVSAVHFSGGVIKNINCQTKVVDYNKNTKITEEKLQKSVADEMQSCWSQFGGGSTTSVLPTNFVTTFITSPVQSVMSKLDYKPKCFECAQIVLPKDKQVSYMSDYIQKNNFYRGGSIYEYLYPDSIRQEAFGKHVTNDPLSGVIYVLYVENKISNTVSNGVIIFDNSSQPQITSKPVIVTPKQTSQAANYCGAYLGG
jgi:hypothetical protein